MEIRLLPGVPTSLVSFSFCLCLRKICVGKKLNNTCEKEFFFAEKLPSQI